MNSKSINKSIWVSLLIIVLTAISCKTSKKHLSPFAATEIQRDTLLLDLFYGMEEYWDSLDHCVLDSIPGIIKLELNDEWAYKEDECKFPASLCIYTDSVFRNDSIAKQVYNYINESLQTDFMYYVGVEDSFCTKNSFENMNGKTMLELGELYFKKQAKEMHWEGQEKFQPILSFRTSIVAVLIHATPDYVTYLFETSIDYNGSCGCPSSAKYITFKNDGTTFGKADLQKMYPNIRESDNQLKQAFLNEAKRKGWERDITPDYKYPVSIEDESFALVKDGVLFYYEPYTIGCGAEGQYNLIIHP